MYKPEQMTEYLARVGWDPSFPEQPGSLEYLSRLMRLHLAAVPFECLDLHYSSLHSLSLNPDKIHEKIVARGRGGYCMEQNTLFAEVLRTLGYTLISTGGRISYATMGRPGGAYQGL